MTKTANRRSARAGFTLLEVLLVIVILVMLATLVMPDFSVQRKKARVGATKIQMKNIEDALEYFKTHVGRYPTSDEGLEALSDVDVLEDEELADRWEGPYLKGVTGEVKDPWNNPFHYTSPGEYNEDTFDLSSDGPDGEEGTEDDITNWQEEEE